MKNSSLATVVAIALIQSVSAADELFPLNSIRRQVDGTCWAYGASHMTEAMLQRRDGFSVAMDIQKSYFYWQVQDRLLNSFKRKILSDGLLEVGGFAGNYWHILAHHGLETFNVLDSPTSPDLAYPKKSGYLIKTKTHQNKLINKKSLKNLEKELVASSMSEEQALEKIRVAVDRAFQIKNPMNESTNWPGGAVPTNEVYGKVLEEYTPHTFVLLSSMLVEDNPELDGKWIKYDDDRLIGIGKKDVRFILSIARLSIDRGWPVTVESSDHVMTLVGYKTERGTDGNPRFYYGIVDSLGANFDHGFSWQTEAAVLKVVQDITVYYPIVKDKLPTIQLLQKMKSVSIPRRL